MAITAPLDFNVDGRVMRRFNCFYGTSAEEKVAKDLFIQE
jgi:hypothetical protein